MSDKLAAEQERLLACVHCGFCLSACPTYTQLGDEADSPRGRLHLMRAVVEGRLDPGDDAFGTHIGRCLGCRACEPVCPSGVQYGFLLERARAERAVAAGTDPLARVLLRIVASPPLTALFSAFGIVLRATGIAALLARALPARAARLRLALAMLAASRPWPGLTTFTPPPVSARRAAGPDDVLDAAAGQNRELADPHAHAGGVLAGTAVGGHVPPTDRVVGNHSPAPHSSRPTIQDAPPPTIAILEGCVQRGLFRRVNEATIRVLRTNGFRVVPVPGQGCCGALHAHSGDLVTARRLARANIEAFIASGADYIAVNAAGCGAMMKEYGEQFARDPGLHARAHALSERVRDVSELLVMRGPRRGAAVPLRVTFDPPCHLLHAQRIVDPPMRALGAVPNLEIVPLPGAEDCCGGAGIYGLQHPDLGGRILAEKLDGIRATGAQVVLTSNPGCMMQIGAGLLLRGDARPVLHPLEILAESYRRLAELKEGNSA